MSSTYLILSSAEEIAKELDFSVRADVRQKLLDFDTTQQEIALWLQEELELPDNRFSAVYRVVQMLQKEELTEAEQEARFLYVQRKNAEKAHEANFDRSAAGKKGAETRLKQMQAEGLSPSGHVLWTEEAREALQALLADEKFFATSGRHKGKPNFSRIAQEFAELDLPVKRSIHSVRKHARQMYLQTLTESAEKVC